MNDNALSIANCFIELAQNDKFELCPLKLMKLVYIVYGYALAMLDRPIIDYRFDKVEAWKFGPVIPSVYHSFKNYGKNPITCKTTMFVGDSNNFDVVTPQISDSRVKSLCRFVWDEYGKGYSDSELVTLMHGEGTPWAQVYEEHKNNPIPDEYTKLYYKELVRRIVSDVN